jgi:hypothetical protein
MKANKLSELTLEELIKKKKETKAAAIGLGIVQFIASALLISIAIKGSNYAFIGVAFGCLLFFLPILISIKQIDQEIKSRN